MWTKEKCFCDHCNKEIIIGEKYYTMYIHGCDHVHEICFFQWSIDKNGAALSVMDDNNEADNLL